MSVRSRQPQDRAAAHRRWPARLARAAAALAIVVAGVWGGLFLAGLPHTGALVRYASAILWAAMAAAALWGLWHSRDYRVLPLIFAIACAGLGLGWSQLLPEQNCDRADDVAQAPPQVDGRIVTLRNVRNFAWCSGSDDTPRWETCQHDLDRLAVADLALSDWMGPAIAHTLVSFGFDDGRRVVFSLEIGKERGESFPALAGFFRNSNRSWSPPTGAISSRCAATCAARTCSCIV